MDDGDVELPLPTSSDSPATKLARQPIESCSPEAEIAPAPVLSPTPAAESLATHGLQSHQLDSGGAVQLEANFSAAAPPTPMVVAPSIAPSTALSTAAVAPSLRPAAEPSAQWSLAFPSISTAPPFLFDPVRAAAVACREVGAFLRRRPSDEGMRLYLLESDNVIRQALIDAAASEPGLCADGRFQIVDGSVLNLRAAGVEARCIANLANPKLSSRGGLINKQLHQALPQLAALTMQRHAPCARPGEAYPVELSASSMMESPAVGGLHGVEVVIHVVGPNVSCDEKPGCLQGDYDRGCALLAETYEAMLNAFAACCGT